ncbi:uncharacterized protein LOC117245952 isoform X2 [Epinephelus lanceolatus]
MDVRMLQSLTFLLTLLPWSRDNGEVQPPLEGLKKQRNQKLQSVKNSRMYELSPHSVLSAISGLLSLPALTFVVFLLLIQTSEGDEVISSVRPSFRFSTTSAGDDVTSSDWPSVKTTTTPPPPSGDDVTSSDWPSVKTTTPPPPPSGERAFEKEKEMMEEETEETSKFLTTEDDTFAYDCQYLEFDTIPKADPGIPREVLYAVIGVLVLTLISTIGCLCWRKNNTVPDTHSTTKQKLTTVSTVSEQRTETADQKEEFLSAHNEVEPKENQRKLQEAQTETAEVRKELQSQLEEVKKRCEENKKKLQEAQTETAKLRDELQSQLEEVKRKHEENKKKLEDVERELNNDTEMTLDKKQKLLGEKENCLKQKWTLKEMCREKEKVLILMDKLLQAVHTPGKH